MPNVHPPRRPFPLRDRLLDTGHVLRRSVIQAKCSLSSIRRDDLASGERREPALSTLAVGGGGHLLAAAVALGDALVLLADLLGLAARVADSGSCWKAMWSAAYSYGDGKGRALTVAVVGVDADEVRSHAVGADAVDNDVAGAAVGGAVAAAAVQLADVDDGEVPDGDSAAAIVLDDLVLGLRSAAALDQDVAGTKGGDGV